MLRATVAIVALALAGSGCAGGIAVGRDGIAARWEWLDVRRGTKESKTGDVSATTSKLSMSDNALAFGEKVAPIIAEAAAKGAAKGAAEAIGIGAIGALCEIPAALGVGGEEELAPDEVDLTPEELEVKRDRRETRLLSWKEAEERETPTEREERIRRRIEIESEWDEVLDEEERLRESREP